MTNEQMNAEYIRNNPEDVKFFKNLSDAEKTNEVCLAAVSSNPRLLEFIPEESRTPDILLQAFLRDGTTIIYLDDKKMEGWMCEVAFQNNPEVLFLIPDRFKTKEMFLGVLSTTQIHPAIESVLEAIPSADICLEVLTFYQKNKSLTLPLSFYTEYVRPEVISYNVANKMVEIDGMCIRDVPEVLRDFDLCEKAVGYSGEALRYVPYQLKKQSPILSETAVRQNPDAILYVPAPLRDAKLKRLAINSPKDMTKGLRTIKEPALLINYLHTCQEYSLDTFTENLSPGINTPDVKRIFNKRLKDAGKQLFPSRISQSMPRIDRSKTYGLEHSFNPNKDFAALSENPTMIIGEKVDSQQSHEKDSNEYITVLADEYMNTNGKYVIGEKNKIMKQELFQQVNENPNILNHINTAHIPAGIFCELFLEHPEAFPFPNSSHINPEMCVGASMAGLNIQNRIPKDILNSKNMYNLYYHLVQTIGEENMKTPDIPVVLKELLAGNTVLKFLQKSGNILQYSMQYDKIENKLHIKPFNPHKWRKGNNSILKSPKSTGTFQKINR